MADDLRARLAAALRDAGRLCAEDCADPVACDAAHPIQATVLHFDQVARVEGPVDAIAELVAAVVQPELDQLTTVLEKLTARSGRCAQCRCDNCNGLLAQHTEAGCGCPECLDAPGYACSLAEFLPSERINLIAQQLGPLLSSHLNERARLRCVAVAHAAHHALRDYDYPEESLS